MSLLIFWYYWKSKFGYSRHDIEIWKECVARELAIAEIDTHDIIQVPYGYGLFIGGLGLHYGAENIGAAVVFLCLQEIQKNLQ